MTYYILPQNNVNLKIIPIFQKFDPGISAATSGISAATSGISVATFGSGYANTISHSVHYYNNLIQQQICITKGFTQEFTKGFNNYDVIVNSNEEDHPNIFNQALLFVNPYQFIFSKIPTYKFSVSKIKTNSEKLYELIEISYLFNIFETFKYKSCINICHIGDKLSDNKLNDNKLNDNKLNDNKLNDTCPSTELLNLLRDNNIDNHICEPSVDDVVNKLFLNVINDDVINDDVINDDTNHDKGLGTGHFVDLFEMIFFNLDFAQSQTQSQSQISQYFQKALYILFIILSTQKSNGVSVIKVDCLHHKLLIDILYILNTVYNKVYIIKPNCASIIDNSRYIVCKHFIKNDNCAQILSSLRILLQNENHINVVSLLDISIPYYFLNKIEEINVIIGQQLLDGYFQIINILKNKNKEEKFETLKRNNILKCMQWCEKYHVPYNKILEKNNMFSSQKFVKNMFNGKSNSDEENVGPISIDIGIGISI